jgi:hypothetical protein
VAPAPGYGGWAAARKRDGRRRDGRRGGGGAAAGAGAARRRSIFMLNRGLELADFEAYREDLLDKGPDHL